MRSQIRVFPKPLNGKQEVYIDSERRRGDRGKLLENIQTSWFQQELAWHTKTLLPTMKYSTALRQSHLHYFQHE